MNEVLEAILGRRSVRLYKDEPLGLDDLETLVEAGRYAPSASNAQDWFFTVVQSRRMIERIDGWIIAEIELNGNVALLNLLQRDGGSVFRNAPSLIVISTVIESRSASINAAAAGENILIAAESMGIASCWIGTVSMLFSSRHYHSYAEELRIPEGYGPQMGITLGYSVGAKPLAPPRKGDVVSYIRGTYQ